VLAVIYVDPSARKQIIVVSAVRKKFWIIQWRHEHFHVETGTTLQPILDNFGACKDPAAFGESFSLRKTNHLAKLVCPRRWQKVRSTRHAQIVKLPALMREPDDFGRVRNEVGWKIQGDHPIDIGKLKAAVEEDLLGQLLKWFPRKRYSQNFSAYDICRI
jgi:hypothetical protein